MRSVVISYSFTGNNEMLASSIAKELKIDHIKIKEPKQRTNGAIAKDMLFNKIPKVEPLPESLKDYDLILFFGPVWMGHVASPLRAYLKYIKKNPIKYAFISISGGADGPNPKLNSELMKRVEYKPIVLIDNLIADLLPSNPKPTRKDTSNYHLNNKDIEKLTNSIMKTIEDKISILEEK